jgi:NNP family nitrate/nitrite transporter-like MFS transporter
MAPVNEIRPTDPVNQYPTPMRRIAVMLTAILGFGVNTAAWSLNRPADRGLWQHLRIGPYAGVLLVITPVVVGSLGRIPVGLLFDRYGARVMLPAISIAAAATVFCVAWAGSLAAAMVAACALGLAGTAFAVGAPLVVSMYPLGQRGLGLSVYGAGIGATVAAGIVWLPLLQGNEGPARTMLIAALLGYAAMAMVVIRDRPTPGARARYGLRRILRLPATRHLSAWYAVAFGSLVALGLFLPCYLHNGYRLAWPTALLTTAVAIAVAAACCPLGGWLTDRRDPIGMLQVSYAAVALMTLLLAFHPPLDTAITTIGALAVCLGIASGVVLALIGSTAPDGQVGLIIGTVDAVGGLAGLLPPALLAATYRLTGSYSIGWTLLTGMTLATVIGLRGQRAWIGAALAFPTTPTGPVTTVVSLAASDAAKNRQGVVNMLAALANCGELVITYGQGERRTPGLTPHALVAGLRARLRRRPVIALYASADLSAGEHSMIAHVLDDGGVILIFTPAADLDTFAARLADQLGAAQVLRLTNESIAGFRLSLPWPVSEVATTGRG